MDSKVKKQLRIGWKKYLIGCIVILIPVISLYLLLILNGKGFNPQILIPTYNDEVTWYSQVEAMIQYGHPLGYEGYNGTHAAVGTFGPWGIATLLPYAAIGKIIGWELHSMVFANVILLSAAIAVYIFLTKPSVRQIVLIGIGYLCMTITIGYSVLSMAESLRYALAIIMTAMLIKLYRGEGGKIFRYVLLPVTIIYSIQVYLIFCLVVPVYIWLILKEKKVFVKLVICVIITGIIALISNYTTALVTSPYVTSTRNSLMEGILNNPYQGIVEMIRLFFQNIETMNPVKLVDLASRSHGIYACFFAVYWIMLAVFLLKIRKEGKKTSFYSVVGFYFLIGFLGGYCALYTGEAATLCRGLNTGIVFMLFFLLAEERQIGVEIFVFLMLFCGISSWGYYMDRIEEKNLAYAQSADYILKERERISEIMDISPDKSIWDNTVAHYGSVTNVYLEFPAGTGTNYMIDGEMNTLAGWAAVSKCDGEESYQNMVQKLSENNHKIVYENNDLVILKRIK